MSENKINETVEETVENTETAENTETTEETVEAEATPETEEGEESQECEEGTEEAKKEGSKFFKKKKDKKDEMIEELNDKYTRLFAEFDNFRKRTEKEKAAMFEVGAKSIIEKILPVIDNFERGLATVSEEDKDSAFVDGMDKVYKQMLTSLEEVGVKQIETNEKEFDPNLHNAVMHVEDDAFGENMVIEEFQKGYTYRESVVRHSMVKVAN